MDSDVHTETVFNHGRLSSVDSRPDVASLSRCYNQRERLEDNILRLGAERGMLAPHSFVYRCFPAPSLSLYHSKTALKRSL